MTEDILDWREALGRFESRGAYERRLRELLPLANESVTTLFAVLNGQGAGTGKQEELTKKALDTVHDVRVRAAEAGAKRLAACALELELAVKAGANIEELYGRFASVVPDTLCSIQGFLS